MLILAAQAALGFPHQYLGLRYFTLGAAVELRFYLAQQAKVAVMLAVLAALLEVLQKALEELLRQEPQVSLDSRQQQWLAQLLLLLLLPQD